MIVIIIFFTNRQFFFSGLYSNFSSDNCKKLWERNLFFVKYEMPGQKKLSLLHNVCPSMEKKQSWVAFKLSFGNFLEPKKNETQIEKNQLLTHWTLIVIWLSYVFMWTNDSFFLFATLFLVSSFNPWRKKLYPSPLLYFISIIIN